MRDGDGLCDLLRSHGRGGHLHRHVHAFDLARLAGNFYELYAIAAAVLGGCSLRGGEGSVLGVVLGTVLLQVLQNLVNLLGIPSSLNFAVMGSVIMIGVLADQQFSKTGFWTRSKVGRRAGVSTPGAVAHEPE